MVGERRVAFWWGEPGGRRLLGDLGLRWENDIKMDLQEVG